MAEVDTSTTQGRQEPLEKETQEAATTQLIRNIAAAVVAAKVALEAQVVQEYCPEALEEQDNQTVLPARASDTPEVEAAAHTRNQAELPRTAAEQAVKLPMPPDQTAPSTQVAEAEQADTTQLDQTEETEVEESLSSNLPTPQTYRPSEQV